MWKGGEIKLSKLPSQIKSPHDGWSEFVKRELTLPVELSNARQRTAQVAAFPAVLTCMIYLELLTCLYTGNVKSPDPKKYTKQFMGYDPGMTDLIYLLFRNNIAHFGLPSVIVTKREINIPTARLRIPKGKHVAWAVSLGTPDDHMTLNTFHGPEETIPGRDTPWVTRVDYQVEIEIQKFLIDLTKSVFGPSGYLDALKAGKTGELRAHFKYVIKHLFPPRYSVNSEGWGLQPG